MVATITAEELAGRLGTAAEPFLLDVREPDEVAASAIPGIVNVPLGQLGARTAEVPRDRTVVCICHAGVRSAAAAEALAGAGWDAVNLDGGMIAWEAMQAQD